MVFLRTLTECNTVIAGIGLSLNGDNESYQDKNLIGLSKKTNNWLIHDIGQRQQRTQKIAMNAWKKQKHETINNKKQKLKLQLPDVTLEMIA